MVNEVIVTAALTGNIHTPTMSPYLPVTPRQLIDEAVRCYEAGAACVHIHVRNRETGQPSQDIEMMGEVLKGIKARTDLIVTVPSRVAAVFARLGNFKVLKLPLHMPSFEVRLHWHQRFHQDPANRWLREVMTDLYAELA